MFLPLLWRRWRWLIHARRHQPTAISKATTIPAPVAAVAKVTFMAQTSISFSSLLIV